MAEALIQTRNQTIIIGGGEINKTRVRRIAILILTQVIVIQDRHGKATRGVPGTNQILGTLPEVMIREEAAAVPTLAAPVPDHPVPVQDLQVADINYHTKF